jgi:hypothetical protein
LTWNCKVCDRHTQKEIANEICEQEADYVLSLN